MICDPPHHGRVVNEAHARVAHGWDASFPSRIHAPPHRGRGANEAHSGISHRGTATLPSMIDARMKLVRTCIIDRRRVDHPWEARGSCFMGALAVVHVAANGRSCMRGRAPRGPPFGLDDRLE